MATSTRVLTFMPGELSLAELRRLYREPISLVVDEQAWAAVETARRAVLDALRTGQAIYGINTGFGRLAQTRIGTGELQALQRNLLLSHATGVGPLLDDAVIRLALVLKINSLARGFSGVRRELIELLAALLDAELYPAVPAKGSVGASGDLAPLAHLVLPLIGEGMVHVDSYGQIAVAVRQGRAVDDFPLEEHIAVTLRSATSPVQIQGVSPVS